jgi:hypothetical protein
LQYNKRFTLKNLENIVFSPGQKKHHYLWIDLQKPQSRFTIKSDGANAIKLLGRALFERLVYIGDVFAVISPVTATATTDSHRVYGQSLLTCLGHLGQHDINRNDPISVTPPKVAKASM